MENAHNQLEGLLRTMHSDLTEKTGANVNVKFLMAPQLVRHCAWSMMRFAIGSDGQTAFKRQRGKDYVGETACFGEAICYRIPLRIQTKMGPRWEADDVFLGKLHLSDEVIVGTHPRAFRQHDHSDGCRQINHGIQRVCACLSEYRGTRAASSLLANVASRELSCKRMERQTDARPAEVMHKFSAKVSKTV